MLGLQIQDVLAPMKPADYPQQPAHLWEHFYQFTQIPRPSKEEAAVRQYLVDLAESAGHEYKQDAEGNLVIYVAASSGKEDSPTVIIQNHLDMVTVKTSDRDHDFSRDPLTLQVADGWLSADRTTLGADNGVGCAAAIAVMTDPEVVHPPLELLFTVDEETGLGGALNLDASMLSGSLMLNLDTEDWNELYIGCAGGAGWHFSRSFSQEPVAADSECWELSLRGLAGGHSGVQIHEQLGNGIKLLAEALRGALLSIPVGQYEAADALGLGYWQRSFLVILPQAFPIALPQITSTFIGLFKETTLLLIIGLFDFLGMVQSAIADPNWQGQGVSATGYLFVALFFWMICFGLSRYSAHLENSISKKES